MSSFDANLSRVADAVMRGVANSGIVDDNNIDEAVTIMREEIKSFLLGDEYRNERSAILAGTIHEGYVLASVIASCITKIKTA